MTSSQVAPSASLASSNQLRLGSGFGSEEPSLWRSTRGLSAPIGERLVGVLGEAEHPVLAQRDAVEVHGLTLEGVHLTRDEARDEERDAGVAVAVHVEDALVPRGRQQYVTLEPPHSESPYRRADFQIRPALCAIQHHASVSIWTDLEVHPTTDYRASSSNRFNSDISRCSITR